MINTKDNDRNKIDKKLDKAKPRVIWGRKATVLLRMLQLSSNVFLEMAQ